LVSHFWGGTAMTRKRSTWICIALAAAGCVWAGTAVVAVAAPAIDEHWVGTWGAAPEPATPALRGFPGSPSFSDQTIRQRIRLSAGGTRLRIRFTNEYGTKVLHIGAASVALVGPTGQVESGTRRAVTFGGKPDAWIPAGAPYLSDPIDLPVKALASLSVSLYLPGDTGPCTCHATGRETAYVSGPGDFVGKPFKAARTMTARAFLSGVAVETDRPAATIIAYGDSITDGVGATLNANRRWPDLLADRLDSRQGGKDWGVVNMGISGNRVLNDGAGDSALRRFDRDVLSVPGVKYVIVFEGVNDLGISYGHFTGPLAKAFKMLATSRKATAAAIIAGYRQLIARAHAHGIKVLGATITPYGGSGYYSPEGNAQRERINRWIRTSGAFDAVLDFDAVWRDPAHPSRILLSLQRGDHLHGNDAGYRALANSIDLALLK
jgi:lysophospholipase L1-like esterase